MRQRMRALEFARQVKKVAGKRSSAQPTGGASASAAATEMDLGDEDLANFSADEEEELEIPDEPAPKQKRPGSGRARATPLPQSAAAAAAEEQPEVPKARIVGFTRALVPEAERAPSHPPSAGRSRPPSGAGARIRPTSKLQTRGTTTAVLASARLSGQVERSGDREAARQRQELADAALAVAAAAAATAAAVDASSRRRSSSRGGATSAAFKRLRAAELAALAIVRPPPPAPSVRTRTEKLWACVWVAHAVAVLVLACVTCLVLAERLAVEVALALVTTWAISCLLLVAFELALVTLLALVAALVRPAAVLRWAERYHIATACRWDALAALRGCCKRKVHIAPEVLYYQVSGYEQDKVYDELREQPLVEDEDEEDDTFSPPPPPPRPPPRRTVSQPSVMRPAPLRRAPLNRRRTTSFPRRLPPLEQQPSFSRPAPPAVVERAEADLERVPWRGDSGSSRSSSVIAPSRRAAMGSGRTSARAGRRTRYSGDLSSG